MWTRLVVALVIGLLRWLASRHDLKESVRKGLALDAAKLALQAQQWKLDNLIELGDPLRDFPVRTPGSKPVSDSRTNKAHARLPDASGRKS